MNDEQLYIVRLYDGFDNEWYDCTKPVSKEEADKVLREKTKNGTKNTKFEDMDYYKIFPSDTCMMFSQDGIYKNHESRKIWSR